MPRLTWPVALLLAAPLATAAQATPSTALPAAATAPTTDAAPPRLTVGLTTANRTVYLQRAPLAADDRGYLGATLTYQAPSGFMASGYLNHSYAYTFLSEPYINYGEAMLGWQSTANSDTYWTVQYTRLFVYGESALVQASLRNDLSAEVTHYFGPLTASAGADLFVGGTSDFVLTFDVSHPFQVPALAHDTLTIEPTVEFGAGSQHFYASSLSKTAEVKTRKRGGTTTVYREPDSPSFAALGYTFSLPISYRTGRFTFSATPAYLLPVNLPTGGDSHSFFYGTLGVSFTGW